MVSLHFCTSESWGGLELYAATLMIELQGTGCEVIAVCKSGSKIESYLHARGVKCEHLPSYRKISVSSLRHISLMLERLSVDVVHVHYHSDIWMASIALRNDSRRRLFVSIYMGVIKKNDVLHRWIYRRVDAFFTSSSELFRRLPDLYPVNAERIHLLPYGRKLEAYTPNEQERTAVRSRLGMEKDHVLVGTMVRIDPGKGVIDFARSFLYLPEDMRSNVTYVIIGEPTRKGSATEVDSPYEPHCVVYMDEINRFVTDEGLQGHILFLDYQDDAISYLRAMDVFVFPSRDELFSLVVLDAMAMRLPVVAAAAGGNVLQIEDGRTGTLYAVGESQDLATKVRDYILDPVKRHGHGEAARLFVEHNHDMKATIRRLLEFYQPQQHTHCPQ